MKQSSALERLLRFDRELKYVHSLSDLAVLFDESGNTLQSTLKRLVRARILSRAANGVFVFMHSQHLGSYTIERIAAVLRRCDYCYVSLESALSEYGVISQIPLDRITIMTTGAPGEFDTPFGVIEFTHTARDVATVLDSTVDVGRPLPMATKLAAVRDLKRVGRNTHLISETELTDID
ncbi:type IV toxin-antitoxin system AbiEi family antitoxin [Gallaecimonas pentaromativorans]|uniref:type IV toxin-antitoxin system AbiEi family antitoxin n=1 Tax=Gallaecimonas pentaromativorans TaxID=584787 RepID=UPI00067F0CBE|nr:hypothetical protein [Gallaecimonas pentaromativorans]